MIKTSIRLNPKCLKIFQHKSPLHEMECLTKINISEMNWRKSVVERESHFSCQQGSRVPNSISDDRLQKQTILRPNIFIITG